MWHVSSRSSVATLRTAIHFLLTYLLTVYGAGGINVFVLSVRLCVAGGGIVRPACRRPMDAVADALPSVSHDCAKRG